MRHSWDLGLNPPLPLPSWYPWASMLSDISEPYSLISKFSI
jgi:hypothetical protein